LIAPSLEGAIARKPFIGNQEDEGYQKGLQATSMMRAHARVISCWRADGGDCFEQLEESELVDFDAPNENHE
jgi:hypothetical protein